MVANMYLDRIKSKRGDKVYEQILLRESYREPGAPRSKVKHRTLMNLSKCDPKEIAAIEIGLKYKNDLAKLEEIASGKLTIKQDKSAGAVWMLWRLAQRIGLASTLGNSQKGRLVLWQVFARLIDQGSRLSATRLAREHVACEVLGLDGFSENDLYDSMDWLDERQSRIEKTLFKKRHGSAPPQLFLYDVTSSYLEGDHNAYGAYGYNRDGKKGKKQIVVGLLCDEFGAPISTEVFLGNTRDLATFSSQVRKAVELFGCEHVTFVGDRGMIKSAQIDELDAEKFHFLTAITKPQIESLIKEGLFQLNMFDEKVCEVKDDGVRYILRRNPVRAAEIAKNRADKLSCLEMRASTKNVYLGEHERAKVEVALRHVAEYAVKLRIDGWVRVSSEGRVIVVEVDDAALEDVSRLDGCYVLKTDVAVERASAEQLHDRYKDLAKVEKAFRTMKTGHLEIRPIFVRTAEHTRAHVFIVMMAYLLRRQLESAWRDIDVTVEEGIVQLSTLCAEKVTVGLDSDESGFLSVPAPRDSVSELFAAAQIKPPTTLPRSKAIVASKRKLPDRRKK